MTPERWGRIKDLFGEAMEREGLDRAAFLEMACAPDPELRAEVETLLKERTGPRLDSPIQPVDWVGRDLGHFQILQKIGEGGMGVVYRARDRKLGREVAIKMLPAGLTGDPERLSRLQGEARALAQLNHPNVASIYGVEESNGQYAVVMELVEGQTLAGRIAKGALSLREALPIATRIAEGLEDAHQRGIVHRDLKPANVKVDEEGRVKILDFGLAKALHNDIEPGGPSVPAATGTGIVMGTLAYMSPEQARGERVDVRSDIWSFGAVLFEMLSGRRPFGGETGPDKVAAVLKEEPDWEALPAPLPDILRDLLGRCLRKDRKLRVQSIGDARIALQEASEASETKPNPPSQHPRRTMAPVLAGLVAGALVGSLAVWVIRPASAVELPLRRFTIQTPVPIDNRSYGSSPAAISPNGKHVVFVSQGSQGGLWIHDLDQPSARLISGSGGAQSPFWSPDGETVAFFDKTHIAKVQAKGGYPVRVCELPTAPDYGGTWSHDGESIVFAAGNPSRLYGVPAAGGTAKPLLSEEAVAEALRSAGQGGQGYFARPHFLPLRGRVLAYSVGYVNPRLLLHDLRSGKIGLVGSGNSHFYAEPGYLLSNPAGGDDLWAVPLSLGSLKAGGEAFRVAAGGMKPSVSRDGTLVYVDSPSEQLAWFDRGGKQGKAIGEPVQGVFYPAISPDGRRVAVETHENANLDLWVQDLERGSRTRLTTDPATDNLPTWSPAGEEIVFGSYRSGTMDIWLRRADGGNEERMVFGASQNERVSDWSRDGDFILFTVDKKDGGSDLWYLARSANGKWEPRSFLATPAAEAAAKFSPDGRYVTYLSDESGRMELYVRAFPRGEGKWAISSNGATQPRWSRDGKEIFYVENGSLVAVPVTTEPAFSAGAGIRLFAHHAFGRLGREPFYDVTTDRQRILLPERVNGKGTQIHVVQNWLAEFRDRKQ